MQSFDLVAHLYRQRAFSRATFGPGYRTKGVVDHIRKELIEIEGAPFDIEEWVDVILLALDGAWRTGHDPESIAHAIQLKQSKNEVRDWPDWRTADPDKAIEHKRERGEGADPVQAFIGACVEREPPTGGPFSSVLASEMYGAFTVWARSEAVRPLSPIMFGAAMSQKGFAKGRFENGVRYLHVRLKDAVPAASYPSQRAPSDCPYVSCPSPYRCKSGCAVAAAEREIAAGEVAQ